MNASQTTEERKRRRERIIIAVTIVVVVVLTFIESHLSRIEKILPSSSDVIIFGLININLILIILLIFLIVRNLVKLIFERRKGILGSRLRTKLVAAFVSLTLIPTIVLFVISIQFLSYNIDNWFELKLGNSLDFSLEIAQDYYQTFSRDTVTHAQNISESIMSKKLYENSRIPDLENMLAEKRREMNVAAVEVYLDNRQKSVSATAEAYPDIPSFTPSPKIREDIFGGQSLSLVESLGGSDIIRGIFPLYSTVNLTEVIGIVTVSTVIEKPIVDKMGVISRTSEEYRQLSLLKNPIKISYIIMLALVTLLITFSATWFGLFLARGITEPILDLADATREIASGNLDYHIDLSSEDEIGVLVDSFNAMTQDLKWRTEELRQANIDLEQRRKYIEAVLKNVSAGIISIDSEGHVTTINNAAEKMLAIKTKKVLNHVYHDLLKSEHKVLVDSFLDELLRGGTDFLEKQIQLIIENKVLTVLVAAAMLRDEHQAYLGMVVVFEDITHLQRIERMAAWREVARRVAHEIKNPLTPVKLSAERLQRRYADTLNAGDSAVFNECTKTIIQHVDLIKNLVNEFSRFARMPVTTLVPDDLNVVIEDSLSLYQDAHRNISFHFEKDEGLPAVNIDAEQIKRVMVNLLDNAVAALATIEEGRRIEIITHYDKTSQKARVDVKDNGPGIPPEDKVRLFEPYFSTKKSGSGLGLSIVDSIIADHNGTIRVYDNKPQGTIITFEIPTQ